MNQQLIIFLDESIQKKLNAMHHIHFLINFLLHSYRGLAAKITPPFRQIGLRIVPARARPVPF